MDTYNEENLIKELVKTEEYKGLNSQVLLKQKRFIDSLPKECKTLFLDYEDAMAALCDFQNKFYFEKGIEVSNANTIFSSRIVNE